ncbi:MAG TPA: carbamoyl phosphate synthase large subunit, partial [Pseudomonadota bacterium]|nr:carbamoyl phosphate synthase large subunit [Pseudomonadota bacterium]
TGEVGCFGDTVEEALAKALLSTGFRWPRRGVLLSLGTMGDKYLLIDEARVLSKLGLQLYATAGTAETLHAEGIACEVVDKGEGGPESSALRRLRQGAIDLVINIPRSFDEHGRPDGFLIRRAAIDLEIPLLSDLQLARAVVKMLARMQPSVGAGPGSLHVLPWRAYLDRVS